MQRFWSYIAVQLGKHAIAVTITGVVVTIALGLGITLLKFATGKDSYPFTGLARGSSRSSPSRTSRRRPWGAQRPPWWRPDLA
jgi:hypothetical protein